jgi:hypothetical protein
MKHLRVQKSPGELAVNVSMKGSTSKLFLLDANIQTPHPKKNKLWTYHPGWQGIFRLCKAPISWTIGHRIVTINDDHGVAKTYS